MNDDDYYIQKIKVGDRIFEKRIPKRRKLNEEPHLAGDEELDETKRPKWMTPKQGSLQEKIMQAVGRKHYQHRQEWNSLQQISKDSLPLDVGPSKYPTEWVEEILEWARESRSRGKMIPLKGVVTAIKNEDRLTNWLNKKGIRKPDNEGF